MSCLKHLTRPLAKESLSWLPLDSKGQEQYFALQHPSLLQRMTHWTELHKVHKMRQAGSRIEYFVKSASGMISSWGAGLSLFRAIHKFLRVPSGHGENTKDTRSKLNRHSVNTLLRKFQCTGILSQQKYVRLCMYYSLNFVSLVIPSCP